MKLRGIEASPLKEKMNQTNYRGLLNQQIDEPETNIGIHSAIFSKTMPEYKVHNI